MSNSRQITYGVGPGSDIAGFITAGLDVPGGGDLRILDDEESAGPRILVVDSLGNGDYTTIQAAINAAGSLAAVDDRWLIRVMPGIYAEHIKLRDYVDVVGIGLGASIVEGDDGVCIENCANMLLKGLTIQKFTSHNVDPVTMFIEDCIFDNTGDNALDLQDSILYFDRCIIDSDDVSILITGGEIYIRECLVTSSGSGYVLTSTGADLEIQNTVIKSTGTGGCIYETYPDTLHIIQSFLYVGSGYLGYTLEASQDIGSKIGVCCGNADIDPHYIDSSIDYEVIV